METMITWWRIFCACMIVAGFAGWPGWKCDAQTNATAMGSAAPRFPGRTALDGHKGTHRSRERAAIKHHH